MIGVSLKKKVSAVFLNSCFLMPMVLITVVVSITPIVQADSVCEVPASNSWNVDENVKNKLEIIKNTYCKEKTRGGALKMVVGPVFPSPVLLLR